MEPAGERRRHEMSISYDIQVELPVTRWRGGSYDQTLAMVTMHNIVHRMREYGGMCWQSRITYHGIVISAMRCLPG
jgi:hypothetical protein